jgi:TRAP-type transport system small permease protein
MIGIQTRSQWPVLSRRVFMSPNESGRLERLISAVCMVILWVTTCLIFFILVANTLLRYSMGSSLQWANELPELLFPWLVVSGVVLAAVRGNHIATTFLMDSLSASSRRVVGVLVWLVVAAMYATLSLATYRMLEIVADERSPILHVPGSVTYGCMLGGMLMLGVMALQSAWQIFRRESLFPNGMDESAPHSTAQG